MDHGRWPHWRGQANGVIGRKGVGGALGVGDGASDVKGGGSWESGTSSWEGGCPSSPDKSIGDRGLGKGESSGEEESGIGRGVVI